LRTFGLTGVPRREQRRNGRWRLSAGDHKDLDNASSRTHLKPKAVQAFLVRAAACEFRYPGHAADRPGSPQGAFLVERERKRRAAGSERDDSGALGRVSARHGVGQIERDCLVLS
jgi:hypothetical protein